MVQYVYHVNNFFTFNLVLEIEPRASCMLRTHSITKPHSSLISESKMYFEHGQFIMGIQHQSRHSWILSALGLGTQKRPVLKYPEEPFSVLTVTRVAMCFRVRWMLVVPIMVPLGGWLLYWQWSSSQSRGHSQGNPVWRGTHDGSHGPAGPHLPVSHMGSPRTAVCLTRLCEHVY